MEKSILLWLCKKRVSIPKKYRFMQLSEDKLATNCVPLSSEAQDLCTCNRRICRPGHRDQRANAQSKTCESG